MCILASSWKSEDVVVEVIESADIVVGSVTQAAGKVVDISKK
jgi:hypothetical protein